MIFQEMCQEIKTKLRNHIDPLLAQDVQIQSFFAYSLVGYLHDQDVEAIVTVDRSIAVTVIVVALSSCAM